MWLMIHDERLISLIKWGYMLMMAANKAGWLYLEAFVDSLNKECCKESKYSG